MVCALMHDSLKFFKFDQFLLNLNEILLFLLSSDNAIDSWSMGHALGVDFVALVMRIHPDLGTLGHFSSGLNVLPLRHSCRL